MKLLHQTIPFFLNHPGSDLAWRESMQYGCLYFLCYIRYAKNMTGIKARTASGGLAIYKKAVPMDRDGTLLFHRFEDELSAHRFIGLCIE